jgi:hypothetical protein
MSSASSATPLNGQSGGSKKGYGSKQTAQAGALQDEGGLLPSSNNSQHQANTFLSDSSTMRDVDSSIEKAVVIRWNSDRDSMV